MDIDHSKLLKELAAPVQIGDRVKAQIQRAAKLSGLPYWRAFDIWYGRYGRVDYRESEAIREAVKLKCIEGKKNVAQKLRLELATIDSLLATVDAELDSQSPTHSRRKGSAASGGYGAMGRALVGR